MRPITLTIIICIVLLFFGIIIFSDIKICPTCPEQIKCLQPYIISEGKCCIDENNNGECDEADKKTECTKEQIEKGVMDTIIDLEMVLTNAQLEKQFPGLWYKGEKLSGYDEDVKVFGIHQTGPEENFVWVAYTFIPEVWQNILLEDGTLITSPNEYYIGVNKVYINPKNCQRSENLYGDRLPKYP